MLAWEAATIRRRRHGFLLPAAVILGAVILGLAGMYYLATKHQTARGHRFKGTLVGRFMAEGAVHLVQHAVRDYAQPSRRPQAALAPTRSLFDLALLPPAAFQEAVAELHQGARSDPDHRKLLDRLLGDTGLSKTLDALAATVTGAELEVFLDLEASALPDKPDWYADPVPKGVTVNVLAKSRYGGREEVQRGSETFVVYPLGSPVLGRFTGNAGMQFHDPAAGFPANPFDLARPDQPLLGGGDAATPGTLAKTYAGQGWVYPRHQVLEPGGGAFGMHGLLWKPRAGKVPVPRSLIFPDPPPVFTEDYQTPGNPLLLQRPMIEGLVQGLSGPPSDILPMPPYPFGSPPVAAGYYREDPGAYPQPPPQAGGPSPFGSTLDPSPTYAPGSRMRLMALSAVTLDRDQSSSDEDAQRLSVGVELPFREGVAYVLPQAPSDPGEYAAAVKPVKFDYPDVLPQIPSDPPGSGFGSLPNKNREVDLDGDGFDETPVASELPFPEIPVFTGLYPAARLFPAYDQYLRFSSRTVDLPLNFVHELATLEVEEAQKRLHQVAWDPAKLRELEAWEELPYGLLHTDPLHTGYKLEDGDLLHAGVLEKEARAAGEPARLLQQLESVERYAGTRWMPEVHVYGQAALQRYFPDGNLRGLRVFVERTEKDGAATLEVGRPYFNGQLSSGLVHVATALPAQGPGDLLEVFGRYLVVGAHGEAHLQFFTPLDGLFAVSKSVQTPAKLRGAAWVGTAAPYAFGLPGNPVVLQQKLAEARSGYVDAPLLAVWDQARDPIGKDAQQGYRIAWTGLR